MPDTVTPRRRARQDLVLYLCFAACSGICVGGGLATGDSWFVATGSFLAGQATGLLFASLVNRQEAGEPAKPGGDSVVDDPEWRRLLEGKT